MIIDIPIPEDDECRPASEERFNAGPKYLRCIMTVFWFTKDEKFILVDTIGYEPFPNSNEGTSLAFQELDALKEGCYFEEYTPTKEELFEYYFIEAKQDYFNSSTNRKSEKEELAFEEGAHWMKKHFAEISSKQA